MIVLHGAHGGPDTNWFPWLESALDADGVEVIRPRMPTPLGQSLSAWFEAYDLAIAGLPPAPTMLVGHSLGAAFALRIVERAADPVSGLFLAAAFVGALGLPDYDLINHTFFAAPFDWAGIRARKGPTVHCWAGEHDPYVPGPRSKVVADYLEAPYEVIPNGRHLNDEAGFTVFPQLRAAILQGRDRM